MPSAASLLDFSYGSQKHRSTSRQAFLGVPSRVFHGIKQLQVLPRFQVGNKPYLSMAERQRICSHFAPPLTSYTQPSQPDAQVSSSMPEVGRRCIHTLIRTWQRAREGSATCTLSKCVFPPGTVLGRTPRQAAGFGAQDSAGSPEATKVPSIMNV